MKLSTKARYGLKAMVDLAVSYGGGPVSTATLAGMQGISQAYLEQLISALKKAELITAERGVQGGYALSRPPETISVGQVLTALEGNTSLVDCVGYETVSCDKACSCSARPLWLKLQTIKGVFATAYVPMDGKLTHVFDLAIDLVRKKRVDLKEMITHTFTLEQFPRMIETNLAKSRNGAVKTMVKFTGNQEVNQ